MCCLEAPELTSIHSIWLFQKGIRSTANSKHMLSFTSMILQWWSIGLTHIFASTSNVRLLQVYGHRKGNKTKPQISMTKNHASHFRIHCDVHQWTYTFAEPQYQPRPRKNFLLEHHVRPSFSNLSPFGYRLSSGSYRGSVCMGSSVRTSTLRQPLVR